MSAVLRAAVMACTVVGLAASALADPIGTWLTASGDPRVANGGARAGWCGEPTAAPSSTKNADAAKRSRPMVGVPIVLDMKPNGPGKWSGEVYNTGDGKTYNGSITERDANAIRLEGCRLSSREGQSRTRVQTFAVAQVPLRALRICLEMEDQSKERLGIFLSVQLHLAKNIKVDFSEW